MAYLFGHIVGLTEGAFLDKTVAVAQAKIADPPLVALFQGLAVIFCLFSGLSRSVGKIIFR